MLKGKNPPSQTVEALLAEMLVDAYGDDEQLWALREAFADALALPMDIHVVGEPLSLIAVDYDGNARRGLTARCVRSDGSEYRIGLSDVQLAPEAVAYPHLAAYCMWLGVEPVSTKRARGSTAKVRPHKASEEDIDLSKPVDLVVLRVKERVARCRLLESERVITLRAAGLHTIVAGMIATVDPSKQWRHAGHPYLSGKITATRIDVSALGLAPLGLHEAGEWDPAEEYWGEEDEPIDNWASAIIARGARRKFEMEQVLPGDDPEGADVNPIVEASDLNADGDSAGAREILAKMLEADLRCLDAHAHLGNFVHLFSPRLAMSHYEVGVRIGELSLGDDFTGVLTRDLMDNRPFLRCLEGYGFCLWRVEEWAEAERIFERILWLNPCDNEGRDILAKLRGREAWVDDSN